MELVAQGVQALAGEDVAALDDDGPPAGGLAAVIEAEDGAGIDPVPAFGFVPAPPQRGGLAPGIALANVPGVQLNDHLVGFEDQFELLLLRSGLLIQLGAEALGALALAFGFAVEGGGGQFHAGEMFEHDAGFGHGQFAGGQGGHRLDGGRVTGAVLQAEGGVGRGAPLAAAFAVAAGALNRDVAEAGLEGAGVAAGALAERSAADGTAGGRRVSLGLGGTLGGGAQEFLHVVGGLGFEVAQVLIGRGQEAGEGRFQGDGGAGRQHGQGFRDRPGGSAGTGATSRGQIGSCRSSRYCHAPSLLDPPRN